ncbi:MAG: SDR family oxidoreductase, partial [Alphaproteobacteria bacterium]
GAVAQMADPEDWRRRSAQRTPLGRIGTAEEIASAIAFLASPAAGWINGQIVVVDGGRLISAF